MTPLEEQLEANKKRFDSLKPGDFSKSARECITALGASCRALGRWEDALQIFDTGVSRAVETHNPEATSGFMISKSCTYYHMGQYPRAIEFATRAISSSLPELKRAEYTSYYLASPYLMLGDLERYRDLQEEALRLTESVSNKGGKDYVPWVLCRLAKAWGMLGDSRKANPVLVDHVAIFRNVEHRYGMPFSMMLLGKNLLRLGKPQESEQYLTEALVLFEENGQEGYLADTLTHLSEAADAMGNLEEARLYADEAIEEARRGPRKAEGLADKRHLNQALIQAARVYSKLDRKHESLAFYGEALDLAARSNRRLMLSELLELQQTLMANE